MSFPCICAGVESVRSSIRRSTECCERHAATVESLRTLAGIPGFHLFISLTFDSLLAKAIGGAQQISYSRILSSTFPLERGSAGGVPPVGASLASPNYAICDDDLLEFLHAMQDKQRSQIRSSTSCVAAICSSSDATSATWLARFFLRIARNLELSQKRRRWDVLVGDQIAHDDKLAMFLESFSSDAG